MSETTNDETLTERATNLRTRLATLRSGRPLTGGLLLWAASALLVLVAIRPATVQITDTSLLAPIASAGAVVTFLGGLVAMSRPQHSSAGGAVATVAVFVTVPAVVALGSVGGFAEMLAATALFGGAGGIVCVGWRQDDSASRSPVLRHGGTAAVVVALLIVVSSGAATAGQFPRQEEQYGGIVIKLDTLAADKFKSKPNCEFLEDCANITVDTRTREQVPAARLELTGITGTSVVISENLQEPDGTWVNIQIRGDEITQTGPPDEFGSKDGFDAYISEYYSDYAVADLTTFGDLIDVPIDEIQNRWLCDPAEDATRNGTGGFGTLDDARLGINPYSGLTGLLDSGVSLREGEDVYQLAHQVGSTQTTIQEFELVVNDTRKEGFQIDKDEPNFPEECAG
jgi:hypothetical protein